MTPPAEAWAALGTIGAAVATGFFLWLTARRGKSANAAAADPEPSTPRTLADAYDAAVKTLGAALEGLQEDQIEDRARIIKLERELDAARIEIAAQKKRLSILEVALGYIGELIQNWGKSLPALPDELAPHLPDSIRDQFRGI